MRQINLKLLGGPRFTLTRDADQFLLAPEKAEWPPEVRPTLHGGMPALHLSIPLAPRRDGPDAGTLWIHLKYPDGHREPVAALSPEALRRFFDGIAADSMERLFATAARVTPAQLEADGYLVSLPSLALYEVFDRVCSAPKREYELESSHLAGSAAFIDLYSPLLLDDPVIHELPRDIPIFALAPAGGTVMLGHFPQWVGGAPGGWFLLPVMTPGEWEAILLRHCGREVWSTLLLVARELQSPCDLEKLQRLAAA